MQESPQTTSRMHVGVGWDKSKKGVGYYETEGTYDFSNQSGRFQVVSEYGITNYKWVMNRRLPRCNVKDQKPTITNDVTRGLDILTMTCERSRRLISWTGKHTTAFVRWE